MRVRVLFHDNCFDGAASAALFTRLYGDCIDPRADVAYRGMAHGHGVVFPDEIFDGDENACVDFRYSSNPKLTWWFDHHISAFSTPLEEAHFRADTGGKKFFDPKAKSCTGFLARTAAAKFGFDVAPHAELLEWADIIDAAQFESPAAAVRLAEPALQLMTWMENNKDPSRSVHFIGELARAVPLGEIASEPWVRATLVPVLEKHARALDVMAARVRKDGGVVTFDVSEDPIETYNKFIPYYLHPDARFVVGLSHAPGRLKISVGSNPWLPRPDVNIASICERWGGGGHPVVGAISLPANDVEGARKIMADIADELRRVP